MMTLAPLSIESTCISSSAVPYSRSYEMRSVSAGSFPGLRRGTKLAFSRAASAPPKMNPRASMPATTSMCSPVNCSASPSRTM